MPGGRAHVQRRTLGARSLYVAGEVLGVRVHESERAGLVKRWLYSAALKGLLSLAAGGSLSPLS